MTATVADFVAKQGDSAQVWNDTLTYSDATSPNLAGASVKFIMRSLTATTAVVNAAATITNNTSPATVKYLPTATDTATAGEYMGQWKVTFADTTVEYFPTEGFLWVEIQQNLDTVGGAQIVSLPDVKSWLNIPANDRKHDNKLTTMILGVAPVVESLVGDVIVKQFDEWYDGGNSWIRTRHRPIVTPISVTEFRGPISWPLKIISDPAHGDLYSVFVETDGTITRRTAGGGWMPFPAAPRSVHAVYTAGRTTVPENIRLGTKELIRVNYQETQEAGWQRGGGVPQADDLVGQTIMGFFVPNRVRELLMPSRRAPSIF